MLTWNVSFSCNCIYSLGCWKEMVNSYYLANSQLCFYMLAGFGASLLSYIIIQLFSKSPSCSSVSVHFVSHPVLSLFGHLLLFLFSALYCVVLLYHCFLASFCYNSKSAYSMFFSMHETIQLFLIHFFLCDIIRIRKTHAVNCLLSSSTVIIFHCN